MPSLDVIDGNFDELVRELRSGRATAGPELRKRVRAIVETEPEPPGRTVRVRRPSLGVPRGRRAWLVAAPLGAVVAVAVVVGVLTSGSGGKDQLVARTALSKAVAPPRASAPELKARDQSQGGPPSSLPPSGSRQQLYTVEMRLRVTDLSATTKRALALTRSSGGYVRSVQYGSGRESGTADLVLRIPIGKVQGAVLRLSALGTILDQHVSIQDVQPQIDARFRSIQSLKAKIASTQAKLVAPDLPSEDRAALELLLVKLRVSLAELRQVQANAVKRASFATVSLGLETKEAAVVVPPAPGRIGQALHEIGQVLVREAAILLYVLLIGAPFFVLALLVLAGRRSWRRRSDEQLLAR